ncbi:mannosyltransferase (PIG-M), putative [Talaromyces stipitatus ATCC 10500]|uniref:GPI mannosyltransferase 1 n=1 Tax=Talaromyces stipitatus (strain ATCC 10500 / CBS 375.48 / QM 6759 / NRRL 1006) TaxID=441959 RepID=B8M4D1_TALSN|nr:mannosyltransferase (PIG-M), putative [Talaromyces stipitatus ATCC 10500]EED19126.1 mannosyltransferase (PIG-M), putative [Talaromyces stipitatus ATCC 10500]
MPSLFSSPAVIFSLAAFLRVGLLFYGLYQDNHSAMKYTDIDYMVFTDASRFVAEGQSPYLRDTYRYTPLLAWFLLPTTWEPNWIWFSFGKVLFAIADLVTGWLLLLVLRTEFPGMTEKSRLKYASIWLLNPMVATISTRGSSEGLLGVMVIALLWAVLNRHLIFASFLLGFGVHFKIYPFIYAPSIIWFLSATLTSGNLINRALNFITFDGVKITVISLLTFASFNLWMYSLYGHSFLQHTYFHHLTRIDHRHNFSPYNTLLYLSAATDSPNAHNQGLKFESVAFLPQLFLSAFAIPLALAKKSLPGAMLAQTFAFVTFNKVCTSQYFLWYLVFLPLYLPSSSFISNPLLGIGALIMWVVSQAFWLHQGFQLEFMGFSTFLPGLWLASLGFFIVNCWILGIIASDVGKWAGEIITEKRKNHPDFDAQKHIM